MQCPYCQTTNRRTAHFCRRCGSLLQNNCPRCRVEVAPDSDFCDNCGNPLSPHAYALGFTRSGGGVALPISSSDFSLPERRTDLSSAVITGPDLDTLIPAELKSKLEQARHDQTMVGERRIVTLLFCDVKGSTAAAEQLDPEEWTEIINGAFEHMIRPIYKYEGTVARLLGDAVLGFFGAPIGHEDDPQRAVLAGLDIIAGIESYKEQVKRRYGVEFAVRVGINTGTVVVGAVGSDLHMEYTATGDAVNLAARMEQTAEPGSVQISENTYRLVAPLFEVEALGAIEVKGKAEPVASYRVLRTKTQPGRVRGIEGLDSPMVGRSAEFEMLRNLVEKVRQGQGQIVSIVGEAGLGKSRLISELHALWQAGQNGSDATPGWGEMSAPSYQTGQPYDTFRHLFRQSAGIAPNDPPDTARDKLKVMLQTDPEHEVLQHVFEMLLGVHQAGETPLDGETFRRELFASMEVAMRRQVDDRPFVYVSDDAHWIDSASLELEAHLLALLRELPILFIFAYRPDREAPIWGLRERMRVDFADRYTEIALQPLSDTQSDEMVSHLLAIAELPDALRTQILEKADGNPFYVEEIVRTLIEQGTVVQDETGTRWQATGDVANIDIPGSLQALVMARIDRLNEDVRQTLQLAAVIGRSFYQRVLAMIEDQQQTLDKRLAELQHMDIIVETAKIPEQEYMFRHTMTQEATYNTLLLKRRREFHLRVGEALEKLFPNRLEELAPTLAHHYAEAQVAEKALLYHINAGDGAYSLYALQEAIEHYRKALAFVHSAKVEQRLHIYNRLGRTYELVHDYGKAVKTYERMAEDGEALDAPNFIVGALIGQALAYTVSELIDPPRALALAMQALDLSQEHEDRAGEARALWVLMLVHLYGLNKQQQAITYGERALEIARTLDLRDLLPFILSDLAITEGQLGRLDNMDAYTDEAISLWKAMDNKPMLASSLHYKGMVEQLRGRNRSALSWAEQGYELARSVDNLYGQATCLSVIGLAARELGLYGQAIEALEKRQKLLEQAEGLSFASRAIEFGILYVELGIAPERLERFYAYKPVVERVSDTFRNWIRSYFAYYEIIAGYTTEAEETLLLLQDQINSDKFENGGTAMFSLSQGMLAVSRQQYAAAATVFDSGIDWCRQYQLNFLLPELLLWKGKALKGQGDVEAARACWQESQVLAVRMESNRILWQVLALLAETAADEAEADHLRQEARAIVNNIAGHIGEPELRRSFLNLPDVQRLQA